MVESETTKANGPVSASCADAEKARVAVFDLDGTCINGQSGSLFSFYLQKRGYLSLITGCKLVWWGVRYKLHLHHRQGEARELVFTDIREMEPEKVLALMRDCHDEVLVPRYRADALAEIARRKSEGCACILVSATFRGIAQAASDYLGMDGFVATLMHKDAQGRYTGEVEGEVVQGPAKPRAVAAWADEHIGVGRWTLEYAYGDHHSDEELLSAAEHAYAVRPGNTLRTMAKRNGWPILEWK